MCPRSPPMQRSRQSNERPRRKPAASAATSTQLVLYDENGNSNSGGNRVVSTKRGRQRVSDEPAKRPAVRTGDVRKDYKVLPIVIGTGSFGTVRSCIHRESRTKLAIKSIAVKGHAGNATLLKNEIALLRSINHRHVVKVVDVMQDGEFIHIIMEQCKGGDLFDMTVDDNTKLGEGKARRIVGSLLDAIAYLHDRDIVHRDLKAEHLMFAKNDTDSPIKIIDFGVATVHRQGDAPMTAFAGSVRSVAPEVVKRNYGRECDLWSCGVITYFLLTQQMPFNGEDHNAVFAKIVAGRFFYPQWAATGLSEEAKDFIDRLIVVDPRRRLTAKQALMHPWIRGKRIKQQQQQMVVARPQASGRPVSYHGRSAARAKSRSRNGARSKSRTRR